MVSHEVHCSHPSKRMFCVIPNVSSRCSWKLRIAQVALGALALLGASNGISATDTAAAGIREAAAGAADAKHAEGLQEIIVTAQKRSESIQTVPIAISAFGSEDLMARGMTAPQDVADAVPNMRWDTNEATGVGTVAIRGIGDYDFFSNQVGTIGLYSDEVSLNSPMLAHFGLFDLERVEVLRGPQNTIFGRNTSGGAIQFISRKPRLTDDRDGEATVTGGNFRRFDVEAASTFRLGEAVALRLSAARFSQGDYLDNLTLNRGEGAFHRDMGRIQLLWRPSDAFEVLVNGHGGRFRGSTTRFKSIGLGTPGAPGQTDCPFNLLANPRPGNGCVDQTGWADNGDYTQVFTSAPNVFDINTYGGSVRFDWRLPAVTITSLSAYEHQDSRHNNGNGGPSYIFYFFQTARSNQFSEELRFASPDSPDAALHWIAGAYYFYEAGDFTTVAHRANPITANARIPGVVIPNIPSTPSFVPNTQARQYNPVYSAYGQMDYKLTKKLRVTAGLRLNSERKHGLVTAAALADNIPIFGPEQYMGPAQIAQLMQGAIQVAPGPLFLQCPGPLPLNKCYAEFPFGTTWGSVGGKLAVDYTISDTVLGYASIARGFKAGNRALAALNYLATAGSTVSPEYVWTYELGMKSQWLANRLRVNIALFLNDWTDEQLFLTNPTPTGLNPILVNIPRTESYGAEAELTWAPTPDWYINTSIGGLHSAVKDAGTAQATVGSVLIIAPKITWSGLVRREWNVGEGRFGLQGNFAYTGTQHFDLLNTPDLIEPGYWVFNAGAMYRFGRDLRYEATLWARNLTRTQYCVDRSSDAGTGFGDETLCTTNAARRFFGLTLHAKF